MKLGVRGSKRNTPLVSFPSRFPEDTCAQQEGRQTAKADSRCWVCFLRQSWSPEGRILCIWVITIVASLWTLGHAPGGPAYLQLPVASAQAPREVGAFHFLVAIVLANSFLAWPQTDN